VGDSVIIGTLILLYEQCVGEKKLKINMNLQFYLIFFPFFKFYHFYIYLHGYTLFALLPFQAEPVLPSCFLTLLREHIRNYKKNNSFSSLR
jgi:hypothetical protein